MKEEKSSLTIGYLDLGENTHKEPKSKGDYFQIASSCFDVADSFLRIIFNSWVRSRQEEFLSPAVFSNASFTCELFLKTLLFTQCDFPKKMHYLDDLFKKLNPDTQNEIVVSCSTMQNNGEDYRDMFLLKLHESRDAFSILRYAYELNGFVFDALFIYDLALVLREVAREKLAEKGIKKSIDIC